MSILVYVSGIITGRGCCCRNWIGPVWIHMIPFAARGLNILALLEPEPIII
jgi:hypothetical protein